MKYKDAFSSCHPLVNFLYFLAVIGITMCFHHPVTLGISLAVSIIYAVYLGGLKAVRFSLLYMLPIALMAVIINPAFNHRGVTILTYLPSGNPLTLESIIYGVAASAMLVAVIMWFRCYSEVVTSDKFIYLFGRLIPSLSLILSMALRFIPLFANRFRVVNESRKNITAGKGVFKKLENAVSVTSIVVTWSLENAVETADSMKSRGFGQKGRTAFSIYRFEERDKYLIVLILVLTGFVICGGIAGGLTFWYYPMITGTPFNVLTLSFQAGFFALTVLPLAVDIKEDIKWKNI